MTTKAKHPAVPDIKFGGIAVPEADTIKLLGVTFDAKLSFRDHLHSIATRDCQRLGVLRRACRMLDYHGPLCAYKGLVRSSLSMLPLCGWELHPAPRPTRPCAVTCKCHHWPWCPSPKPVPPPDCIWAGIPVQAPVHPRTTPAHRHDLPSSQPCRSSAHPESTPSWPAAPCAAAAGPGQERACLCFSLLPVFCYLSMEQLAKRNCKGSTQLEAAPHVQRRCP